MGFGNHFIFLFLGFFLFSLFHAPAFAATKSYIVYLGSHSHGPKATSADFDRVTEFHHEFLGSFLGSSTKAKEAIFYSYTRHINGFAAILDEKVAADIERHPKVLKVLPNQGRKLHTTRSWEWMSQTANGEPLPDSLFKAARFGEDTIIGNLDTGVWPESASFSDEGMGPIPSRWKGSCVENDSMGFRCNRKLIGAKYFNKGYFAFIGTELNYTSFYTARDTEGHGSHTLSTAGGNFVAGANISGLGSGMASGGSARARVAAYKVCWRGGECYEADILAGFDMAIHDGVDVLSVSLGGGPMQYLQDGFAIGSFHAFRNGINVVCSAGNSGPYPQSVTNIAPWIFTVAASTLDREFEAVVELHNGQQFKGASLSEALPEKIHYPLIVGAEAKLADANPLEAEYCFNRTIDPEKAKGKILVCIRGGSSRLEKGVIAKEAGAVGMILCNSPFEGNQLIADVHILPAALITYKDCLDLLAYMNSTTNPMGYLHPPKTNLHVKPAPSVASFSSRGPNLVTPEILKPDITAPGVNIIAAFTQFVSPSNLDSDTRRIPFTLMSGTSMSCPHVAGVVGLLRTLHPDWSSSAIKSAIMTTARTRDNTGHPMLDEFTMQKATPFEYGSGHIRPNKAMDPGLVYDLTTNDYLNFLCAYGYNATEMMVYSEGPYKCPYNFRILDFNYPSIAIPTIYDSVNVSRTLKNVGSPGTYVVRVHPPKGVAITVEPKVLKFDKVGEEKRFILRIEVTRHGYRTAFGGLVWSDGKHFVRSSIAVGGVNF